MPCVRGVGRDPPHARDLPCGQPDRTLSTVYPEIDCCAKIPKLKRQRPSASEQRFGSTAVGECQPGQRSRLTPDMRLNARDGMFFDSRQGCIMQRLTVNEHGRPMPIMGKRWEDQRPKIVPDSAEIVVGRRSRMGRLLSAGIQIYLVRLRSSSLQLPNWLREQGRQGFLATALESVLFLHSGGAQTGLGLLGQLPDPHPQLSTCHYVP